MTDDVLLDCLIEVTHRIGRPASRASLIGGLPLKDHKLDLELFPRAAAHAGLRARSKRIKLVKKSCHYQIPPVLMLKEGKACLLLETTPQGTAKIIRFASPKSEQEISLEDLNNEFSGLAIFLDHHLQAGLSEEDSAGLRKKPWFWNTVNMLWASYSEILVASFLINVFALAVPLFTMNVYDRVIPNSIFDTLWVLASGVFIVLLFDVLMRTLRSYFIDQSSRAIDILVSANILERVLGIKMMHRPTSVGAFSNTVQSFDAIREFISSAIVTVLIDVPFALLFLIVIAMIGGSLVFIPIILFALGLLVSYAIQKPLNYYTQLANRYASEKQALLHEMLNGIESVKTNCVEPVMQSRWENLVQLSSAVSLRLRFVSNIGLYAFVFIQQLAVVLVVITGVYYISSNSLTIGGLIAATILTSRALAPMSQVAGMLTRYHKTKDSLESLDHIMNLPIERPEGYVGLTADHLKGDIEFKDVHFTYPDHASPILGKVSIKINAGEKVAIIGKLGSGKTTIAKLLAGLLQPSSGSLYFDTVDQGHYDLRELRKRIGYVPQDIMLFSGTIHDNITIGQPDVEDDKVINAIRVSGADEFVKPALGDYEAKILERGKNLSGGQKQIIAIARAALFNPKIVVMDEPTNAMDNQTEQAVIEKLRPFIKDKTFVLMTHHPSLLSLVDRVIVIDSGAVVADGPKDQVLRALSEGKISAKK